MADNESAKKGAISGIVINVLAVLVYLIVVFAYRAELGDNLYPMVGVAVALILAVYPPSISTYTILTGDTYSYENYFLQVFLPVLLGLIALLGITYADIIKNIDSYHESLVISLASASLLASFLVYTFVLFRIKYHGT